MVVADLADSDGCGGVGWLISLRGSALGRGEVMEEERGGSDVLEGGDGGVDDDDNDGDDDWVKNNNQMINVHGIVIRHKTILVLWK